MSCRREFETIIAGTLAIATTALLVEAAVGYPDRLFQVIGHPVVWIGAAIGWTDQRLNDPILPERRRRLNGALSLLLSAGLPTLAAWSIQRLALAWLPVWMAWIGLGLLAAAWPAQRSLWQHVRAVHRSLVADGLQAGRRAVGMIVGRDTALLDEAGIVRAAIESLAENFSDGVVAPLLWCSAFGLPGVVFYKAVNTADSMIGHRTLRHEAFGCASARLDDLINLPASRLAAFFIIGASPRQARAILTALWRDAGRHRSPNAGWPEAAMAAALGLRLAGPRRYHGVWIEDAWMGDGRDAATQDDLDRALRVYRRACGLQAVAIIGLLGAISA